MEHLIHSDDSQKIEVSGLSITQNRYALYLQGFIGQMSKIVNEPNNQEQLDINDQWISIWRFVKVKSVAIAEKGEDVYLTVAEFFCAFFLMQFICCLLGVSLPSRECYFIPRISIFIIFTLIYGFFLLWMTLNTRIDQMQSRIMQIFRIPFVVSRSLSIIIVLAYCNAMGSILLSSVLFYFESASTIYIVWLCEKSSTRKERLWTSFSLSFIVYDLFISFVFGILLVQRYETIVVGCLIMIASFFGIIFLQVEVFLQETQLQYIEIVMVSNMLLRIMGLTMAAIFLLRLDLSIVEMEDFLLGVLFVWLSSLSILILTHRICKNSTQQLRMKLDAQRRQSDEMT
eukprot:TRINITY_DN6896_c0_g2_i1.p2 TRINITY_DN6896_c0_g2~~TRINITY_DN6896_c0_g2_i1.p2  ORF type:complete len:343 (-),score=-1.17 TRINITY_DN6896_c0_g2_i1:1137-2165(-)